MKKLRAEDIKEIAEQLDCGFLAFVHSTTGQMLFIPNECELPDIEFDVWKEELELLEKNSADFYEIEKWTSSEAFQIMEDFAENLNENKQLQGRLLYALNKRKPFREFKFIIDNSGDFRQQWFDFKNNWQQDFVEQELKRLKLTDD